MIITKDNISKVSDVDFKNIYRYNLKREKEGTIPNYLNEFHKYTEEYPKRIPKTIKEKIETEKKWLSTNKYDYDNVLVVTCVMWIQKNVHLVGSNNSGLIKLTLVQKWMISTIMGWFQTVDVLGTPIYERLTKEVLIMVASGFGKSTFLSALNVLFLNVNEIFGDTQIFIGAGTYKQARLIFDGTNQITKLSKYKNDYAYRDSIGEMQNKKHSAKMQSISSKGDNWEGIQPCIVEVDEIHTRKTSEYSDNLRKNRSKRRDMLFLEITTQGTERGGYLDTKLEYVRKVLAGDIEDDEKSFIVFENESIEEVIKAFEDEDYEVIYKSNPNLGVSQSPITLMDMIKDMVNDPSKRTITLTKNFNIPQNKEQSFFSRNECEAHEFDESILIGKPVFMGLDVAKTRSISADFTCFTIMYWNPNTDKRYYKDWYFIPERYADKYENEFPLVREKSKYDGVDYEYFIERGDMVLVDDTQITQDYIINFISQKMQELKVNVLKFGVDPAFADKIITHFNTMANNSKFCIEFRAERKQWTQDPINITKESRSIGKVYDNNKFTVINFANANASYDSNNYITITNTSKTRKDGVSAHLAVNSSAHVWSKQVDEFKQPHINLLKNSCPLEE